MKRTPDTGTQDAVRESHPRIEYLRVENYRALRRVELKGITPLTVLLGPNGSGKSTLFDVFSFLSESFQFGLRHAWDRRGRSKELKTRGQEGPVVIELKYRCHTLKQQLEQTAESAGLMTRTTAASRSYAVLNRIVIEELESWYFGDWYAVRLAYPHAPADIPGKRVYRDPDAIAPHLEPARNRSRSFQVFRDALLEMAAE